MATAYTGGDATIIAEHAYHGSTKWMADLSSNEWPAGYHPEHVATFAAPRRSTGGVDRETAAGRIAGAAARLADHGDQAALVLADVGFTSEGILDAAAEFIAGLVDGATAQAPCSWPTRCRWASVGSVPPSGGSPRPHHPRFVSLGQPRARERATRSVPLSPAVIADSLARDYEYFSTFAATPAAAAAGLAVLDVLENERIPQRTSAVGDHCGDELRDLARQDARLGDVRGTGLIAGIDVTGQPHAGDHASRRALARALLDALRDHHVLAGLTGPDGTVLKVRPPLIWHAGHADSSPPRSRNPWPPLVRDRSSAGGRDKRTGRPAARSR